MARAVALLRLLLGLEMVFRPSAQLRRQGQEEKRSGALILMIDTSLTSPVIYLTLRSGYLPARRPLVCTAIWLVGIDAVLSFLLPPSTLT